MGRMIESVALSRGHEIVCIIDAQPIPCPSLNGKKIFTPDKGFASEAFCSADVAIEFSRPEAAERNIRAALAQGVPVVCGTTGWDVEGLKATLKPSNPQTLKPSNPQTLNPQRTPRRDLEQQLQCGSEHFVCRQQVSGTVIATSRWVHTVYHRGASYPQTRCTFRYSQDFGGSDQLATLKLSNPQTLKPQLPH